MGSDSGAGSAWGTDEAGSVDQGLQFGRYVGKIGGAGQNDAVGLEHLLDALVGDVVVDGTTLVLVLEALGARGATPDGLAGQLDQFGLDSFLLQLGEELSDQNRRVAVLAGAAVEGDDFHLGLLCSASRGASHGPRGFPLAACTSECEARSIGCAIRLAGAGV